jgi:hypothetical protein
LLLSKPIDRRPCAHACSVGGTEKLSPLMMIAAASLAGVAGGVAGNPAGSSFSFSMASL